MARGGCKACLGVPEQMSSESVLHRCNPTRCKMGLNRRKTLSEDICSGTPKHALHPPQGKETIHCPAPVRNFSLPKTGGHRGNFLGVDMAFLVFIGVFASTSGLESFFAARNVPQKIFLRWWSCTFFSSLLP